MPQKLSEEIRPVETIHDHTKFLREQTYGAIITQIFFHPYSSLPSRTPVRLNPLGPDDPIELEAPDKGLLLKCRAFCMEQT